MSEQKPGGYGSGGNWRKYLVWYLIGGGVVYLLVWFLFLKDGGLYG